MIFFSVILRALYRWAGAIINFLRILQLRLLYPGLHISFSSTIENNCTIRCIVGGKLRIQNSFISFGTQIIADENAIISIDNSFVGRNCVISAKEAVVIKKGCLLAEMVVIRDQDHQVDITAGHQPREFFNVAPIEIQQNVWIASKATVLKGVTIGKFSVVAASAVINQSVPAYEVWGGIPGKCIKKIVPPPENSDTKF